MPFGNVEPDSQAEAVRISSETKQIQVNVARLAEQPLDRKVWETNILHFIVSECECECVCVWVR